MKKRFLLTSALMLLLTVLALTSATYAWFTLSNTNKINDFTITTVSSSGGLEISLDGERFSSTDVTIANPVLNALDVTSADGKNFYKALTMNDGNTDVSTLEAATANTDYFEYKVYFKTTNAGIIKLDLSKSYIVPASLKDSYVNPQTGAIQDQTNAVAGTQNLSASGQFTRDWIAAATRVSFMVTGYQNSTADKYTSSATTFTAGNERFVNLGDNFKRIALSQDQVSSVWSISKMSSRDYNIYNTVLNNSERKLGTTPVVYNFELDNPSAVTPITIAEIGTWQASGNDPQAAGYFPGSSNASLTWTNGNNIIIEVTIRIWIEGQDLEAKVPLTQGKFTSSFKFDFVQRAAEDQKVVTVSGLKYVKALDPASGQVSDTLVSGLEWAQLSQGVSKIEIYKEAGETDTLVDTINAVNGAIAKTSYAFETAITSPSEGDYYMKVTLLSGYVFADKNATENSYNFK